MTKNDKLVQVYRSAGEMQAHVIKGLLEGYGIPCLLQSNAAPSVHMFTIDGMGEYKVLVRAEDVARARELI